MVIARRQIVLLLIVVAVVAALIGSGATALALGRTQSPEAQSRKLLLRQIDEYDQWRNQPRIVDDLKIPGSSSNIDREIEGFKMQRPEFSAYHSWFLGQQLAAQGFQPGGTFTAAVQLQIESQITAEQLRNPTMIDQFYASRR